MIAVDASALVAILLEEPEEDAFLEVLSRHSAVISPVGYWEAHTRISGLRGDEGVQTLNRLLANFDVTITPASDMTARLATQAQAAFGKRTPARLNLGDCFAYALAREQGLPLLYKGDDFAAMDIEPALTT